MDKERKMEEIRTRFSEGSSEYDGRIRQLIPRYDEMLDALISSVRPRKGQLRAIDVGCGTGAVSELLLQAYPDLQLTCLDMTESMLGLARERLNGHDNVSFVLADIYDFGFEGPYDIVVSSLALHHLITDHDKKEAYRKIFEALGPEGSFFNADIVLGSDDAVQELYLMKWKEFMYRSYSKEEVDRVRIPRYRKEDSPARLIDHLRWLDEVGFRMVDVTWKYYNFAVYGGRK